MDATTTLRFHLNSRSLAHAAELTSNTILLASNAYLVGSNLVTILRTQRQQQTMQTLQTSAEIASATASVIKVVTSTWEKHHAP